VAHPQTHLPTFNQAAFAVGIVMAVSIGIMGVAAFLPNQANSTAGKNVLMLCDFGFKSGLGGLLGLIGGGRLR
jgi:hypothetical protein